jgi:hypothetical protein
MANVGMRQRGAFAGYSELMTKVCPVCGVLYAAPSRLFVEHERNGGTWYCPNGHDLVFCETVTQKLERERERREEAERRARAERDLRADTERRLTAQRGATTRARNQRDKDRTRVAAGVCPCCNRTFKNLAAHMAGQHPDFGPLGHDA